MSSCADPGPLSSAPRPSAPRPSARLSKAFLKPSSDDEDPPRTLGQLRSGPPEEPRQGDEKETEATAASSSSSRSVTGLQPPPRLAG